MSEKVYLIRPGEEPQLIDTLDGLHPNQETVQLLIKDEFDSQLSYDNGERYIFGGATEDGRWISVGGVKCWYQTSINSLLSKNVDDNKYYFKDEFLTQNNIGENLYRKFGATNSNNQKLTIEGSFSTGIVNNINSLIFTPRCQTGSSSQSIYEQHTFQLDNIYYSGILPVIERFSISGDKYIATLHCFVLALDKNHHLVNSYQTYENLGWKDVNTNNLSDTIRRYQFKASGTAITFNILMTEMEYYYALGLSQIYEKATYEDVQQILDNKN